MPWESLATLPSSGHPVADTGGEAYVYGPATIQCDCPGDISGGGVVDSFDLAILLGAWCSAVNDPNPPSPPCENCLPGNVALADISGAGGKPDGCVDAFDLAKLLANWGQGQ